MTLRRALLTLHLWIGIVTAPILLLTGLSGAVLAFQDELHDALNARLTRVVPGPRALGLDEIERRLQTVHPGSHVALAVLPRDDAHSYVLTVADGAGGRWTLYVDQYTGRVIGTSAEARQTALKINQFHQKLLAGRVGSAVVVWCTVALAFLALSGLWLWWPSKLFTVRWTASGRRIVFDVHRALGAYTWAVLLVFALTGMAVHWIDGAEGLFAAATRSPRPAAPPPRSRACVGQPSRPPDALLASAAARAPGARPMMLQMPGPDDAAARVALRYPEDRTPSGRTIVLVETCTGRATFVQSTRTAPPAYRLARIWNRAVHTGQIGGWPTQVLACVFSLTLPLLSITGPLIWWQRQRRAATRRLDRLTAAESA